MKSIPLFFCFTICFSLFAGQDTKQVTYLGIHTDKLSPSTTHQLDLPQGIYLEVIHVGEGSPAQKAGLQAFDILRKFDDQILINQDQLKQLVRMKDPGDSVSFDLLRRGKSMDITVQLEETIENANSFSRKDPFSTISLWTMTLLETTASVTSLNGSFAIAQGLRCLTFSIVGRRGLHLLIPTMDRSTNRMRMSSPSAFLRAKTKWYRPMTMEPCITPKKTVKNSCGLRILREKLVFEGPVNTEDERKSLPKGLLKRLKALENQ